MWCGALECELKMKEEAGVSSRCIPFEQERLGRSCVVCGKSADLMAIWGVAY
jgi:prolyl-tRNA synthetase